MEEVSFSEVYLADLAVVAVPREALLEASGDLEEVLLAVGERVDDSEPVGHSCLYLYECCLYVDAKPSVVWYCG